MGSIYQNWSVLTGEVRGPGDESALPRIAASTLLVRTAMKVCHSELTIDVAFGIDGRTQSNFRHGMASFFHLEISRKPYLTAELRRD